MIRIPRVPGGNNRPRRSWRLPRWTVVLAAIAWSSVAASAAGTSEPQGSHVAWGRLKTDSTTWSVHEGNDGMLAQFIRQRSRLNIDPTCYPVSPAKIDELCQYPFVFTNNLSDVRAPDKVTNLREYLRRGGFIYIDRCVNLSYSLPQEEFYQRHVRMFNELLPDATLVQLPRTHGIFRCHFDIKPTIKAGSGNGHDGIYGLYYHGRMVALLSLSNYQCGWPQSRDKGEAQMEMIANIYVYAMTAEPDAATASKPAAPASPAKR